jgi:hypothetical protein
MQENRTTWVRVYNDMDSQNLTMVRLRLLALDYKRTNADSKPKSTGTALASLLPHTQTVHLRLVNGQ